MDLENYKSTLNESIIKSSFWYFLSCLFFETKIPFPSFFKCYILKLFGAKIGKSIVIKPNVKIKYPWKLSIGDFSWIGEYVWIDNVHNIEIGCNCCISQGAYLLTGNHNYKLNSFDLMFSTIRLGNSVWIGAKAVVCPGVVVHDSSILTVGSVATSNVAENSIYQGNPALFKKNRFNS